MVNKPFPLVILVVAIAGCSDLCGNDVLIRHSSPSGEYEVVVFQRSCGATTPFSIQGSIIRSGAQLPNKSGNLFVVDSGLRQPSVKWIDDSALKLSYEPQSQIRVLKEEFRDVKILVNAGIEAT